MRIRSATPADVTLVLPMVRAICALHEAGDPQRFGYLPDVVDRYARWLPERAGDPRSVFLVAQRPDGTLAGFVVGTVEPDIPIYRVRECGLIHDLWVETPDRRKGVAKGLTEAALERFRAIGVTQVRLDTAAFNDAARALFGSCGFRTSVVEMLTAIDARA